MSTRCYPLFIKGNPQLRVFLPNFWMKLVKPVTRNVPNQLKFVVSMEMTKSDVKNYLEKIYDIPIKEVRTTVVSGAYKKEIGGRYIIKEEDFKLAYVIMPDDKTFDFPNLFPEDSKEEKNKELKMQEDTLKASAEKMKRNWDKPGIPTWFGKQ